MIRFSTEKQDRIMGALFGLSNLIGFYMPKTKPLSQNELKGLISHLWRIFSDAAELNGEEIVVELCAPAVSKIKQYCENHKRPFYTVSFPGTAKAREALGL